MDIKEIDFENRRQIRRFKRALRTSDFWIFYFLAFGFGFSLSYFLRNYGY